MHRLEIKEITTQISDRSNQSASFQGSSEDSDVLPDLDSRESSPTTALYATYLHNPKASSRNVLKGLTAQHRIMEGSHLVTSMQTSRMDSPTSKLQNTQPSSHKDQPFNITKYVPYETGEGTKIKMGQIDTLNMKQDNYKQKFYEHREVNKHKISQTLHDLAMEQIVRRVNKDPEIQITPSLESNKQGWAQFIIKSKKVQKIFCNFTDQIAAILELELGHNKTLINDYMNIPHKHAPQKLTKHVSKYTIMSTLEKAREKINQIQKEVQKKQNEDKIEKEHKEKLEIHINDLKAQHFDAIIERKKDKSKKKAHKHPMAQMFDDSMKKQNQLLAEIEANDKQFSAELHITERQLEKMESTQGIVNNPGVAISNLMQKWGEEPLETKLHFHNFATELWKTRSQFEKEIYKEEKGYEIMLRHMEDVFLTRTRGIRNQAGFRIQALETALIETKIKAQLEKDRCNMRVAEIESTFFNAVKSDREVQNDLNVANQLLSKQIDFNDAKVQAQLTKSLVNLTKAVMSLNVDKSSLQGRIKDLEFEIQKLLNQNSMQEHQTTQVYNQLSLCQSSVFDLLQFTPFSTPDYPLFSVVDKSNYELLSEAMAQFDYNKFKMTTISNQQKLEYFSEETCRVEKLLQNLNFKDLMTKHKLFARDKQGMIVETMNEFQKIGLFAAGKTDNNNEGRKGLSNDKKSLSTPADPNDLLEKMGVNVEVTPAVAKIMAQMAKALKKQIKTKNSVLLAEEVMRKQQDGILNLQDQHSTESGEDEDQSALKVKINSATAKKGKQKKIEVSVKQDKKIFQETEALLKDVQQKGQKNKLVIKANQQLLATTQSFENIETLHSKETLTLAAKEKIVPMAINVSSKHPSTHIIQENSILANLAKQSSGAVSQLSKNSDSKLHTNKKLTKSEFARAAGDRASNEEQNTAERQIQELYKTLIEETQHMDEQDLKFNTSQFEELHREFQVSLDQTLKPEDYMQMFQTMQFDDLFGLINTMIPKYVKTQNQKDLCLFADCIVADLDPITGSIRGFSLRVQILKVLFYQDRCGIKEIKKVIKRVNYLNRILKSDREEFGLIRQKKKEMVSTDSQANIELPETIEKIEVTPDIQHLFGEIRQHLIGVAARGQEKRHQYYNLMWGDLQFNELLQVSIPGMQSQEDQDSQSSIIGMAAKDYLSSIFKLMNEKVIDNADEERLSKSLSQNQIDDSHRLSIKRASYGNSIEGAKTKQKSPVKHSKKKNVQLIVKEFDVNSENEQSFSSNFSESGHAPQQQLIRVLTPKSLIGSTSFKPNNDETIPLSKGEQQNKKLVLQSSQTQTEAPNQIREPYQRDFQPPITAVVKVQNSVQTEPISVGSTEKRSPFVGMIDQVLKNEINRTIDTISDFVQNVKEAKDVEAQIRSGSSYIHSKFNLKGDSPERTLQNVNDVIAKESEEIQQCTIKMIKKAMEKRETQKTFGNRKTTFDSIDTHSTLPILINGKLGGFSNSKEKTRFTDSNFVIRPNLQRLDKRMLQTQIGGSTKSQFNIDAFREKFKSPEPQRPNFSGTGNLSGFTLDLDNPARMQIQLNGFLNETSTRNLIKIGGDNSHKQSISDFKNNSGTLMRVPFKGGEAPLTVTPVWTTQSVKQIALQLNQVNGQSVEHILRKRNTKLEQLLSQ